MKTAKYFDVHDKDVTPEIYNLLFCGAYVELNGNDQWYDISPFGWEKYQTVTCLETYDSEESFKTRLDRGPHNCYYNTEAMQELCDNPITCEEAVKRFKEWLIAKGVTPADKLFVAIWW